ncbi:unnamed protein product [Acanthosepion pharaonis]|uniref:Uncharacterized protein n=1 Tax=Acanthosepion pharaonis TaxID=158019 RepID=A0A812B857_ACAPH|nr:unnamed protein product [Sepia pharaonis]
MANRSTDGFHSLHLSSLVSLRQVSSHYVNSRLCFFLSNVFFFGVTHSMSIRLFTFSCLIVPLFFLINHIFIYLMPIRRSSTSVLPQFFFLPMSHFNRFFLLSNSFICDNFSSVISFLSFAQYYLSIYLSIYLSYCNALLLKPDEIRARLRQHLQ